MGSPQVAPHPQRHASPPVGSTNPDAVIVIGSPGPTRTSARLGAALRAAPGPRDEQEPEAQAPLTTEELAILVLLADGLALHAVAARVAMSPRTVSRRLRGVCDRLGVAHPIQAIVWAARRGLV
jgi:DNA-binding NarL/FixJ family response regulator